MNPSKKAYGKTKKSHREGGSSSLSLGSFSLENTINSIIGRGVKSQPVLPYKKDYPRSTLDKSEGFKGHSSKSKENSFQKMWLESQRATKKTKQTYVIILALLWLSVLSTFFAKPWENISKMSKRNEMKKFSLKNIKNSDQSHILLCRAMLEMDTNQLSDQSIVIEEDRRVCLDRNNPYSSLLQIFASSVVAQAGKDLNLEYRHRCNPRDASSTYDAATTDIYATIQETLRSSLLFNSPVDKGVIKDICRSCIDAVDKEEDGKNHFSGPECILFPHTNPSYLEKNEKSPSKQVVNEPNEIFELVLPSLIKNIDESADQWILTNKDSSAILQEVNVNKNVTNLIDPHQLDDATIYLSCAVESHGDKDCEVLALPYYVFAREIPPTVKYINIIASTSCAAFSSSCTDYGGNLQTSLAEWYPRAEVNFEISESSAISFAKMIRTNTLICVASVSCVFPALANDAYVTLIESSTLYPWLSSIKEDFLGSVTLLPETTPLELTSSLSSSFLMQDPQSRISNCRDIRGRMGSWQQDMEFAKMSQYKLPLEGYAGAADVNFQPAEGMIYRTPTTYKWVEDIFPKCSADFVTLDKLCASLDVLMINRIYILGDSLSLQHAQSLWKLLGFLDNFAGDRESSGSRRVQCHAPYQFDFEIAFSRNDRLLDVEAGPTALDDKNCKYGYCWPWVEKYTSSPSRTLLIANTGAHSHKHEIFYEDFDTFINLIDSFDRPNDLVWFRTSVPGHKGCDTKDLTPFKNYAEYVPTITEVYSWDKFIDYNDYATRVLRKRNKDATNGGPTIDILDVYPMTILRPDGHAGGADCINCGRDDCLHYSLPGPIDWWNHLMLSNLVDLASEGH